MDNEDDEEELQDEQGEQEEYSGNNFASRMADDAKGMAKNARGVGEKLEEASKKQAEKAMQKTGKAAQRAKARSEKLQKAAEKAQKVAEKAEKFARFAAKIGKAIALAGIFILILILIIGLLVFIITGWGIIMSGLKQIVADFWDAIYSSIAGAETVIHDEEVVDLMDTIEEMGYDLYGYGFVSSTQEVQNEDGQIEEKCYEEQIDPENGATVNTLIKELDKKGAYNRLKTYLVSDNYAYLLKNENISLRKSRIKGISDFFSGIFNHTEWGSGLISVYKQEDETRDGITIISGKRGDPVASIGARLKHGWFALGPTGVLFEVVDALLDPEGLTSSVSIDRAAKTLDIEAVGLTHDQVFHYNLDGWTGRYSMPLEFLLATHIATMAPDLSTKLAVSFDTDVEILLWKSKDNKMTGAIKTEDGTIVPYDSFKQEFKATSLIGGRTEAAKIFKNNKSLHSQTEGDYRCTGAVSEESIGDGSSVISGEIVINEDSTTREFNRLTSEDIGLLKGKIEEVFSMPEDEGMELTLEDMQKIIDDLFGNDFNFDDAEEGTEEQRMNKKQGKYFFDISNLANAPCTQYRYGTIVDLAEFSTEDVEYELHIYLTLDDYDSYMFFDKMNIEYQLYKLIGDSTKTCSTLLQDDDSSNDPKKTCKNCYKYLQKLYLATKALSDKEFDVFVPYINSVTDHWFRNVYFTYGALEQYKKDNSLSEIPDVIVPDEDYYLTTGEMWTLYELDPNGDYELYVYLKDGDDYRTDFETRDGKYLVCRETEGGSYGISEETGNMYVPKNNGGYALYLLEKNSDDSKTYIPYTQEEFPEFKVGKKAITRKIEDKDWNVYSLSSTPKTQDWTPYEYSSNDDSKIQDVKELEDITLMYKLTGSTSNITQTEDAVRGETNSDIKEIFLDDYYLYDGNGSTAALIEKAKEMADSNDPDDFKKKFGENEEIRATYQGKEYGPAKIKDISGPINILQNSLTAFSMLKNMHTLDAEYIYHDFKELIVELDYFDKEDLTEATEDVMMFPIAGTSSAGWPNVRFDKNEEFYGTLLHSAQDYAKKKEQAKAELAEIFGIEEIEEDDEAQGSEEEATTQTPSSTNAQEVAGTSQTVATQNLLVQAAADIMSYMQANDYAYCQGNNYHPHKEASGKVITPEEAHSGRSCYRATSFEDSMQSGRNLIDCSGFVSWCLQEVGILPKGTLLSSGTLESAEALKGYYTMGNKVSYEEYEPGTILLYNGHTNIYAGNGLFYDAGSTNSMMKSPRDVSSWRPANEVVGYIVIPNNQMTYNGITGIGTTASYVEFEGYEGGEAVLAPVTGEVIKYGTVERTNLETGEKEDTGFIKIRVLGDQEAPPGTTCNYFADQGYNCFWEEYAEAGITNHVLYIEGFDVSEILTNLDSNNSVNGRNIKALSNYISNSEDNDYHTAYQIPRTLNEKKREELELKEKAKEDAVYTVKDSEGKIYIKEGAVIGYTYTEDQAHMVDGVGNYMRLIFRDKEEQVVENVEEYIEVESALGMAGSVQAEGSEIEFLAGVLTAECGGVSEEGMTAAAWVIRNRLETGRFGASLAEILTAPLQFEVVSDTPEGIKGNTGTGGVISIEVNGKSYYVTSPTDKSLEIAQKVMNGELPNPIEDRLYWKSAQTEVDAAKDPIQIPAGTGNKFHY